MAAVGREMRKVETYAVLSCVVSRIVVGRERDDMEGGDICSAVWCEGEVEREMVMERRNSRMVLRVLVTYGVESCCSRILLFLFVVVLLWLGE